MNSRLDFSTRATEAELMDRPDCDGDALRRTLDHFATVNRIFSRVRSPLRRHLLDRLPTDRAVHVIDLGCGACDIPLWLLKEANRRGRPLRVTAVDADARVVAHARARHGGTPGLEIVQADALALDTLAPFDLVIGNHFLHHLPDAAVSQVLADARRLARVGVVFTDLARSRFSHAAFSLLALPFRHSYIRADGLLSIRKGFRPSDFPSVIDATGYQIQPSFPGRILLLAIETGIDSNF